MDTQTTDDFVGRKAAHAKRLLLDVIDLLDREQITYHLEGGTLLGIVRDGDLLPWDHDVDISIPDHQLAHFQQALSKLPARYKFRAKKTETTQPFWPKGRVRIFKVYSRWISILKNLWPSAREKRVILDVFVKFEHEGQVYWQAFDKVMRVDSRFYASYEEVPYEGRLLKVPNDYENYLAEKYGDWRTPVKEWHAGEDEKTIFMVTE